ncbi:hypothetical protein GF373_04880 [bacterium]|nr:hypothetical protein [bacterium]
MKVTTLFHIEQEPKCPSDEQLYLFLDESDTNPEKRAFLNHCSVCEPCMQRWESVCQILDMGTQIPEYEPDPSVRSHILQAAYTDSLSTPAARSTPKTFTANLWRLPGWRLAWAALFLVMSWGVYLQVEQSHTTQTIPSGIESEILSLQEEIELLQTDLGMEIDQLAEEIS